MTRYQMTIVKADEWREAAPDAAEAVVKVRTEGGRAFIEEITVRAPAGTDLIPDEDLLADLGTLVRLLGQGADGGNGCAVSVAAQPPAAAAVTPAPERVRRGGQSAAGGTDDGAVLPAERVYRRMPDVAALREAYERAGTITGVAEYFGVPRHTAQGWITRLRRRGVAIGNPVG